MLQPQLKIDLRSHTSKKYGEHSENISTKKLFTLWDVDFDNGSEDVNFDDEDMKFNDVGED